MDYGGILYVDVDIDMVSVTASWRNVPSSRKAAIEWWELEKR